MSSDLYYRESIAGGGRRMLSVDGVKKRSGSSASTSAGPPSVGDGSSAGVLVPRRWLVAVTALLVLPWLVVGALYVWHRAPAAATRPAVASSASAVSPGPWGALEVTPIVISPPLEYVDIESGHGKGVQWFFPGMDASNLDAFLLSTGLSAETRARLLAAARPYAPLGSLVVTPPDDVVRGLTPNSRAAIYAQLARSHLNADQANSFRFFGDTVDVWLGSDLVSAETRALIAPLIYRHGGYLHFADMRLIGLRVGDDEERRLEKVLHGQATLRVDLRVGALSEVPALVEYWGRGGRRTDIKPLLESAAGGGTIDIIHLLPSFGREYLYRYPKITGADLERPVIANCLWTSLNFFSQSPDDRYLDVAYALDRLKHDYFVVESGFELGDVIAFIDADDVVYHAAVYIADNLVLTKNGTTPMAPWIIVPLDRVVGYYATRAAEPRLVYHRRKGL
jgi:hypothetical protein